MKTRIENLTGWIARDERGTLALYGNKPSREQGDDILGSFWYDIQKECFELPRKMFPELTWRDEPINVNLTIKVQYEATATN